MIADYEAPALDYFAAGLISEEGRSRAAWYERCKPVLEVALAGASLVALLPVISLAMALVKLTSRGPAIYSQVRVGHNGREFVIYKIRTMWHDCERSTGPQWARTNDPRVTPLGHFLRRTHLDELPQLWNVLRGDMSLVGPRPERPEFVVQLERVIPEYRERLRVRPGVTGLAQVQLPPDTDVASVRRKVACDLCYTQLVNPWLDVRILVGTALKIAHVSFDRIRRMLDLPGAAPVPVTAARGDSPTSSPERIAAR